MSASWQAQPEKGAAFARRLLVFIALAAGRRVTGLLLRVIIFYYTLTAASARRASKAYLARVLDRTPGFFDVYQHFLTFAVVSLDRFYFLNNRFEQFDLAFHDTEVFDQVENGGILITAHVGSFDALRAMARTHRSFRIRLLIDVAHNAHMMQLLKETDPDLAADVIDARMSAPELAVAIQSAVEAGHYVGIMGDRLTQSDRAYTAEFLGSPTQFPEGLWQIAAMLKCPVIACLGLYSKPNRYDLYFKLISHNLGVSRKDRALAITQGQALYLEFLSHWVKRNPNNWFNFYDFWQH
ncbi:MAG: hypothetical protein ACI4NJ_10700 [Cellvibrio sp.]